ncbi:MAG TPA: sugar-binding domain-containing protein [Candidatus Binatia bacterium]|nr:sugar-binding domain-containing protein [Candidatus Binatia bacterium]
MRKKGARRGSRTPPLSLLHTAARLYYEADLSQQDVASRLGVSPATVSRMLRRARALDIVRIEVRELAQPEELAGELAGALALVRVAVVEAMGGARSPLGEPVGRMLTTIDWGPGSALALGWGRTVHDVVGAGLPPLPGAVLVPAVGGLQELAAYFQVNEIVRVAAGFSGATPRFLHAPALPSAALRDSLRRDADPGGVLELWDGLSAAVVGVGSPPAQLGDYGPSFVVPEYPRLRDAAGDVLSHYFDVAGHPVTYPDEGRLLALSREQLHRTPLVIGVAAGRAKAPAIVGAVRAGLINALVTEATTAEAMLALLDRRRT